MTLIVSMLCPQDRPRSGALKWLTATNLRVLLACTAVVVVGSFPAFLGLFLNDDASYALIGEKLNQGGLLYRDAVDNKPPLIYLTFAATFRAFGHYNMNAIKVLTIAVNVASAAFVFGVGSWLFTRTTGAIAALFFASALVCGVAKDSIATNTESYMNLFVLAALWLLVRGHPVRGVVASAFAGLFLAIATLFSVQSLVALPGVWLHLVLNRRSRSSLLLATSALALGFALPIVAVTVFFCQRGAGPDIWRWAVADNFTYVGSGSAHGGWSTKVGLISLALVSQLPILIPCGMGLTRIRGSTARELAALRTLIALLAGSLVAYQLGGRFYGHYFLRAIPSLSLLGAWGFERGADRFPHAARVVPGALLLWVVSFAATNALILSRPGRELRSAEAAAYIRRNTRPGDQVLLWAGWPSLLVDSGRVFGTRFMNNNSLTGRTWGTSRVRPEATPESNRPFENRDAWQMFQRDMEVTPPQVIVDGAIPHFQIERYSRLSSFVARRYGAAVLFGVLRIYVLRGPWVPESEPQRR